MSLIHGREILIYGYGTKQRTSNDWSQVWLSSVTCSD